MAAHATALGRFLAAAALTAFALAFILGTLAPALLALVLLAGREGARKRIMHRNVQVTRQAPNQARSGDVVTLRIEATSDSPLPLGLNDATPDNATILEDDHHLGRGTVRLIRRVRLANPGAAVFGPTTIQHRDAWGLWQEARLSVATSQIAVAPEPEWDAAGRRAGKRNTVQSSVRARHSTDPVPQVERVREYLPGDRARDIDWKRSTRNATLFTKEREKVSGRPVLIFLDATLPMRWKRRHAKITSALRVAEGVAASAQAAGVRAAFIAFHEDGITESGQTGQARSDSVLAALATMPAPEAKAHPPLLVEVPDRALAPHEYHAVQSLGAFVPGPDPALPALEKALARATGEQTDPSLVVAILDAETSPRRAEVAVRRLAKWGHHVVLVIPATGPHHYTRAEGAGPARALLREAYLRRERAAHALRSHKVPVLVLRPDNIEALLQEVARCAR